MRFRRLETKELAVLEKEFIQFLAVSGVEAQDWENFKTTNPKFCEEKIEEFSDVVIGGVLHKAKYAEHCTKTDWMLFKLEEETIHLIVIHSDKIDLTCQSITEEDYNKIDVFNKSKAYSKNKEDDLFEMMNQGCLITDGALYEKFDGLS
jgi:hypothetical protein